MAKANFFDRKAKVMPTATIDLPSYGKVVLEKLNNPKSMAYWELSAKKYEHYSKNPFPPVEDENGNPIEFTVTQTWCDTVAMATVMQKMQDWGTADDGMPIDNRYSFEEIFASSLTDEDDYNLLIHALNDLNATPLVADDPKALTPEASSSAQPA